MLTVCSCVHMISHFFFFNDTATTEIYTLSLHDALPIWAGGGVARLRQERGRRRGPGARLARLRLRSEEHTSELQSRPHLVCRLLLEKNQSRVTEHVLSGSTCYDIRV